MSMNEFERSIRQQLFDMQERHRQEIKPLVDQLIRLEQLKTAPSITITLDQAIAAGLLVEPKPYGADK